VFVARVRAHTGFPITFYDISSLLKHLIAGAQKIPEMRLVTVIVSAGS
jgi:hypothetical protein